MTWCEELTYLKRPWCWERLKAGGKGVKRRKWDDWMASPTLWTWVRESSGNWWWTGKPGILKSMGLQSVRHDWVTKLILMNWCWSSNPLATWREELTHWKRPWCWERLKTGGEGDDRGWVSWMASLTRWTWLWAVSGSWWWTGKPGVLQSMGSQRVGHNWVTKLNWTN